MVIKHRLERLEKQKPDRVVLATIPADATLEEATRIYESNLKLSRQAVAPMPQLPAMTLEEATAIVEPFRSRIAKIPKVNSNA